MKRILTAAIALFAIVVVSGCKKTPAEILINGSPVMPPCYDAQLR